MLVVKDFAVLKIISVVYLFFNSLFLPHGLLYTTLLSPLFFLFLSDKKELIYIIGYLSVALIFATFHILQNPQLDIYFFTRSFLLYFMVFISSLAAYVSIKNLSSYQFLEVHSFLVKINFFFFCFAVFSLLTPFLSLFWMEGRLKMLHYEPSYYATLISPLFIISLFNYLLSKSKGSLKSLFMISIPLLFTLSAGVIGSIMIASLIAFFIFFRQIIFNKRFIFILFLALIIFSLLLLAGSSLIDRFFLVIAGSDSSGIVRTFQSNYVANKVALETSIIFGSGFGQSKLLAIKYFDEFWLGLDYARIANSVAGLYAEFGILGILLKFFICIFLFFKTRVINSPLRICFFIFVFTYQFTGSYTTNLAEYILWILAFLPILTQYETKVFGN